VLYAAVTVLVGGLLMLTHIPLLYELLKIEWVTTPPLWTLEGP